MNDDTNVNAQMSDDNEDVQDGEAMKKELGKQGIEIENAGSESTDEMMVDDDEEDEEISSDDGVE